MPDQIINLKELKTKTDTEESPKARKKKIMLDKKLKDAKPRSLWGNFLAGLIQGIGIALGIIIALGIVILVIELLSNFPEVNEWIGKAINL